MKRALVIGANGTIGRALINELSGLYDVVGLSREDGDYSEQAFVRWRDEFASDQPFSLVICCVGVLHNHRLTPERKLDQLTADSLLEYFRINSVIPALCIKFFGPLLDKAAVSKFVCLSAMVGSISDNKLGGWYGYRASKAALNMIVKTASIELATIRLSNQRSALSASRSLCSQTRQAHF